MTTASTEQIFCRAMLNYAGAVRGNPGPREMAIRDGRHADLPGWEACGFERHDHASTVADWDDDAEIERIHHPEMEELARALTGCDHALVSGHIKRNPSEARRHGDLAPIQLVHSDFADSYGDQLRELYRRGERDQSGAAMGRAGIDGETVAEARRIVVLQFWRNLGPAKMDLPLAWCDARTVPRSGIRAFPVTDYAGGGFDFEALAVLAPASPDDHRWYAFPELRPDEVVAFRTFDTARVGTDEPYWTPHCAFRDPEVELGRPSRSSIELRATCIFG